MEISWYYFWMLSLWKLRQFLFMFSTSFILFRVLLLLFLLLPTCFFLCTVFDSVLSNIEVISINHSPNVFVFADSTVNHLDWLTYPCRTDTTFKFCHNFSFSLNFNPGFHFLTLRPDSGALDPDIFYLILVSELGLRSAEALRHLSNSHQVIWVFIDFPVSTQGKAFIHSAAFNLFLIGDIWDVFQEGVINLGVSAVTAFCEWNQVRTHL